MGRLRIADFGSPCRWPSRGPKIARWCGLSPCSRSVRVDRRGDHAGRAVFHRPAPLLSGAIHGLATRCRRRTFPPSCDCISCSRHTPRTGVGRDAVECDARHEFPKPAGIGLGQAGETIGGGGDACGLRLLVFPKPIWSAFRARVRPQTRQDACSCPRSPDTPESRREQINLRDKSRSYLVSPPH